jgi:hypothetical protein
MPKISYLDILDNGADYTEVTASHIEQKIADIEALLRGMIDEDNLLAKDDGSGIVPISPSNVVDMPVETRPVNHSMKFFGTNTESTDDIVDYLFTDLFERVEDKKKLRLLNSIGDKEIIFNSESEKKIFKTVDVEIPNNYVPVTWSELWEIIQNTNPNIAFLGDENPEEYDSKEAFFAHYNVNEYDAVIEVSYNFDPCLAYSFNDGAVDLKENSFTFSLSVIPLASAESWLFRLVSSLLCRVNP